MPQGSSASPGWFVKVINEVIKDLKQVAAYLDDVIVFDSDPIAHVQTIRSLFERLRKHDVKLSPSKARLVATGAKFLGHSISPAGSRPNAEKVSALDNMPMPTDVTQVRALTGGINYYLIFLPDLSKRFRQVISLLRKGVKFLFTPAMEKLAQAILAELATPPILVSLIGTLSPTAHVRSTCTATLASTGLAPLSNGSRRTAPRNPSRISVELRSTRRGFGLLLIWRPTASFGLSYASEVTFGEPNSAYSQTIRPCKA